MVRTVLLLILLSNSNLAINIADYIFTNNILDYQNIYFTINRVIFLLIYYDKSSNDMSSTSLPIYEKLSNYLSPTVIKTSKSVEYYSYLWQIFDKPF